MSIHPSTLAAGFKLDTSGFVSLLENDGYGTPTQRVCFAGLTPFAQGYTVPILVAVNDALDPNDPRRGLIGFDCLAPVTVERIIADCGDRLARHPHQSSNAAASGRNFWVDRQEGVGLNPARDLVGFLPLTPELRGGLIYFREAA